MDEYDSVPTALMNRLALTAPVLNYRGESAAQARNYLASVRQHLSPLLLTNGSRRHAMPIQAQSTFLGQGFPKSSAPARWLELIIEPLTTIYLAESLLWVNAAIDDAEFATRLSTVLLSFTDEDLHNPTLNIAVFARACHAAFLTAHRNLLMPVDTYVLRAGEDPNDDTAIYDKQLRRPTPAAAADALDLRQLTYELQQRFAPLPAPIPPQPAHPGSPAHLTALLDQLVMSPDVLKSQNAIIESRATRTGGAATLPPLSTLWACAFLAEFGAATSVELSAWVSFKRLPKESLLAFNDRFERTKEQCNGQAGLPRQQVLHMYLEGLAAIQPLLHNNVRDRLADLQDHLRTFETARTLATSLAERFHEFAPIIESPAPPPRQAAASAPLRQQPRAHAASHQCPTCLEHHPHRACFVHDPRNAPANWRGPINYHSYLQYVAAWEGQGLDRVRGAPMPWVGPIPESTRLTVNSKPSSSTHSSAPVTRPRYLEAPPPASYAPRQPKDTFQSPNTNYLDFGPHSSYAQFAETPPPPPAQPRSFTGTQISWQLDPPLSPLFTFGSSPTPSSMVVAGSDIQHPYPLRSRSGTPPAARPPPAPIAAAPQLRAKSPRATKVLPSTAPPIPFPAVPISQSIPPSQLPDAIQRLRAPAAHTPQRVSNSLPPPPSATHMTLTLPFLQNLGPGCLEHALTPDSVLCLNLNGNTVYVSLEHVALSCSREQAMALLDPSRPALPAAAASASPSPTTATSSQPPPHTPTASKPAPIISTTQSEISPASPPAAAASKAVSFSQLPDLLIPKSDQPALSSHLTSLESLSLAAARTSPVAGVDHTPVIVEALAASEYPAVYTLPPGDPATSLSLVRADTGTACAYSTCIYDSGSNMNMLSADFCKRQGIQYSKEGAVSMLTSSGSSHTTCGRVTTPVHFTLPGQDSPVQIALELQVVDTPVHAYDILLGTPFMNALATSVDIPTGTMRYRPKWMQEHDPSGPVCSIPITTTTSNPSAEYIRMLAPLPNVEAVS